MIQFFWRDKKGTGAGQIRRNGCILCHLEERNKRYFQNMKEKEKGEEVELFMGRV